MSIKINLFTCRLLLILMLAFISCNSKTESIEMKPEAARTFNSVLANSEYAGKDLEDKWDYLLISLDSKYSNPQEFENWFLEKFNQLKEEDFTPNESVVQAINEKFLGFEYFIISKAFAEYTLYSKDSASFGTSKNFAYNTMAEYFIFNQQIDSTAKYLNKLERGLGEDALPLLTANFFNIKAEKAVVEGNMFEAVINFKKALEYIPESDKTNRFMVNLSLAGMYNDFDFIEKAGYYKDRAYNLLPFDSIPDKFLNTLGIIEYKSGNFEKANQIFSQAIQFGNKNGRPDLLAPSYSNYSNLRVKEKKYEEALELLSKSDSICSAYDMQVGFLINHLNRAEIYRNQKLYNEALNELELAYPDVTAFNSINFKMAYYQLLHQVYDGMEIKALADSNYRIYTELQKEYEGDISRSAISEWELSTERELAENNLNRFNLELERQIRVKYLIALLFTIFLLVVGIIFFFIYNNRRKEKERFRLEGMQLREELESKSKELLTESLNNLTVQNTKEEILGELEIILNQLPDKVRSRFSVFNQKLKSGRESNFLDEFEMRFKGVYESFYQKLSKQAPDLTPNDLRICAFIRLNISSKDIARLTGKSLGTIDNNKTVIRKKLNLSSDNNLQKYLLNL